MPLQNRVAPDGSLFREAARGMFTGNRGVIHDPDTRTLSGKRWTTQSWIVCTLHWQDRRRDVWGRNRPNGGTGWSELFFLDEVTALAAGHRPCFYCRRPAASAFITAFDKANGFEGGPVTLRDRLLHSERLASRRSAPMMLAAGEIMDLPDGAMIKARDRFFAIRGKSALGWAFSGYEAPILRSEFHSAQLVTPPATCRALAAGFKPVWHPSSA